MRDPGPVVGLSSHPSMSTTQEPMGLLSGTEDPVQHGSLHVPEEGWRRGEEKGET